MDGSDAPGGNTVRLSGKIYSVDSLIAAVSNHTVSPSNYERFVSSLLFVSLFVALNISGYRLGGAGVLLLSLLIHEVGHMLGMLFVGWSTVKIGFGLLGPFTMAKEDISAARKAAVALAAPALGLVVAMITRQYAESQNIPFFQDLSRSLYFITVLNLLPIKPFDGYTVVEHLVFIRHPKIQMFYLSISGGLLFLFAMRLFYAVHGGGRCIFHSTRFFS